MDKNVNETPTLVQTIRDVIGATLCDLHVCLPARVVSYDSGTQKATVAPEIKRQYRNGDVVDLPNIQDVPVIWPRGGGAFMHLPLAGGDQCTLVFSERSLDEWKESGGSVQTKEKRKFSLSDAYAIPGGYPFSNPAEASGDDIEFGHGQFKAEWTKSGKMAFKGNSGEELLALLVEYFELNNQATTNTIFGPMRKNEHPQLILITERLKKLVKG
jgi:hypothetical protein